MFSCAVMFSISQLLLGCHVLHVHNVFIANSLVSFLGQEGTGYSQSSIKRPCLEFRLTGDEEMTAIILTSCIH